MDKPTQPQSHLNFQEPPQVTVIEASCKQAHQKSEDFSSFTTILKNPLIINKGDEIRAVASYIDCPGIDSEIIQFTRSGPEQDNTHTMVSQMYTVNDGFQQKTTSYDYMSFNGGLTTVVPGGNSNESPNLLPASLTATQKLELRTFAEDGVTQIGFGQYVEGYNSALVTGAVLKFNIINGGINYSDGDTVTTDTGNASGLLFVDSNGTVKSVLLTNPTKDNNSLNPGQPITFTFKTRNPSATGCVVTVTLKDGGYQSLDMNDLFAYIDTPAGAGDVQPNGLYRPGDLAHVYLTKTDDHLAGVDTGCRCYINSVFQGNPARNLTQSGSPVGTALAKYFDQGYNYQRTGLQRWCQTYENTNLFCYGRNFERKFLANDNIEYNLPDLSSVNIKDSALSASIITRRKEDEFVPGFFHSEYNELTTFFQNKRCAIEILGSTTNVAFFMGREDRLHLKSGLADKQNFGCGRLLFAPIQKNEFFNTNEPFTEENQVPINVFPTSILSPGMVVSIKFEIENIVDATADNILLCHNNFQAKWGGIYPIGSQRIVQSSADTPLMQHYIGPPAMFDDSVSTGIYTKNYLQTGVPKSITFCQGGDFKIPQSGLTPGNGRTAQFEWVQAPNNLNPGDGGGGTGDAIGGGEIEVGGVATPKYLILEFNVKNDGTLLGNPYFQSGNLPAASGWKVGDVLKPSNLTIPSTTPNLGFGALAHPAFQDFRVVITSTDSAGGADFGSWDQLSHTGLKINGAATVPVKMIITPMPYYMSGLQTFRSGSVSEVNPNGYGVQSTTNRDVTYNNILLPISIGGQSFDNYDDIYPPTISSCFSLKNSKLDGYVSEEANCILHKPAGQSKISGIAKTKNDMYSYHDSSQSLTIGVDNKLSNIKVATNWKVGPTGGAGGDHIISTGAIAGQQYPAKSITFNFLAIAALEGPSFKVSDLPLHGLVILNEGTALERHLMMDGPMTRGSGTPDLLGQYTVALNSSCVPQTESYNYSFPTNMNTIDEAFRENASLGPAFGFPNIPAGPLATIKWINQPWRVNDNFTARFTNKGAGGIAYTNTQNFFGNNDINLNSNNLLKSPNWQFINSPAFNKNNNISSYNKGGIYLLSQNIGAIEASEFRSPYRDFFGFAQGFNEFIMYDGMNLYTPTENQVPTAYNNKLLMVSDEFLPTPYIEHASANNATNVYGYEPMYNQKTFIINRNFVVPSDIASRWDAQSHKQQGLIDRDTGEELAKPFETGLVQNEFVHPVYGSNNYIQPSGEYLKDLALHPFSGGLRGGHCIGVGFVDREQDWLNPNLYPYLLDWVGRVSPSLTTTKTDAIKHYKIFFRTPFTTVRNYDPLKFTTHDADQLFSGGGAEQVVLPDRTPLHTLQTDASNIGNTSRIAASQTAPAADIPFKTKKLIDGTIMSYVESPSQVGVAGTAPTLFIPATYDPNVLPNKATIGELMERSEIPNQFASNPNGPGPRPQPNSGAAKVDYQSGGSTPFPGKAYAYPFRYVQNTADGKFERALVSQFAGSTNITLAFDTDVSSFTFQFFYQPFTSPFRDGSGGDIATRIFYGNRKVGLYNHDSLGGIVAMNWARPNYPRGTFGINDIENNPETLIYPNGIDPFSSVATVGNRFLNKLGFNNSDLDIVNNRVNQVNPQNTGFTTQIYTKDVAQVPQKYSDTVSTTVRYKSINIDFKGTNFSLIDSSDAILSAIDAPENSASLNKNNTVKLSGRDRKHFRHQLNGDYIFYPYSLSTSTDSFQSSSGSVRFDNCTDAYGSIGGMRLSNVARGMGTPNTQGSTSICDQSSIPVTLNVDCNLYLSYSAATPNSNAISATNLPKKINHGHLIVLSSLIEEPNFIMAKAGAINGISLISKAFLTGDFILSNGMLSWYAKKDRVISSITTRIVNTNFDAPTVLGDNTTVIYSITNNQPKPMDRPTSIYEIQTNDYQVMAMMQQHLASVSNSQIQSPLTQLEGMLDNLGIGVIENGDNNKSANLISELRNQINAFGLNKLSPSARSEFFKTPAGSAFIQNAGAMRNIMSNMKNINEDQQNINDGLGDDELIAQHNKNIRTTIASLRSEGTAARARMADTPYVIPPDPMSEPNFGEQVEVPDQPTPFQQQVAEASQLKDLPHAGRRPPEGDARKIKGDKLHALKEKRRQAMEYKLETEQKERDRVSEQTVARPSNPNAGQDVRITWSSGDMGATVMGEGGSTKD